MWRKRFFSARRLYSALPVRSPTTSTATFRHFETTYPAVATLADAFTAPSSSRRPRRVVFQSMTASGRCLLADGNVDTDDGGRDTARVLRRILASMIRLQAFDETFKAAQRQGKLSFFLESRGEEAAVVASAAALEPADDIFSQYREHGALLWRGASFEALAHQCCGSREDSAKGRQMPVHYGDRGRNFHTVSSPLATQLLHAVGFAYAKTFTPMPQASMPQPSIGDQRPIVACYFGDGTASEGDFHAALNFASTLRCPVVFICRNNGYAIATPTTEQYAGDGIVSRAEGYGMASCRVDGGDARAVFLATREARQQALATGRPVLLELMTYRLGDHSTSDDRRNYVPKSRLDQGERDGDPIKRLARFLSATDAEQLAIREEAVLEARRAIDVAQRTPRPDVRTMFDDAYDPAFASYEQSRQRRDLLLGGGGDADADADDGSGLERGDEAETRE